jgi:hypothetical protein
MASVSRVVLIQILVLVLCRGAGILGGGSHHQSSMRDAGPLRLPVLWDRLLKTCLSQCSATSLARDVPLVTYIAELYRQSLAMKGPTIHSHLCTLAITRSTGKETAMAPPSLGVYCFHDAAALPGVLGKLCQYLSSDPCTCVEATVPGGTPGGAPNR